MGSSTVSLLRLALLAHCIFAAVSATATFARSMRVSRVHGPNDKSSTSSSLRISVIVSPFARHGNMTLLAELNPSGSQDAKELFNTHKRDCLQLEPAISYSMEPPQTDEYASQFQNAWTQMYIYSKTVHIEAGNQPVLVTYHGENFSLSLPAQGGSTRGLFMGDPCVGGPDLECKYLKTLMNNHRTPWILNAAAKDIHLWSILGDSLYDHCGDTSATFFHSLSPTLLSKPLIAVPGNHDFWIAGSPEYAVDDDQHGFGFMQFYAQDTAGYANATQPFNMASDANKQPLAKNFLQYHLVGSVGSIAWSGAHAYSDSDINAACAYFDSGNGSKAIYIFLLSHWNAENNNGCATGSSGPAMYKRMKDESKMPSCAKLVGEDRIKYFFGHSHINTVWDKDKGFLLGGQGMEYKPYPDDPPFESLWGFQLFEVNPQGRTFTLWNINLATLTSSADEVTANYNTLRDCYGQTQSLFSCLDLPFVQVLANVSLAADTQPPTLPPTQPAYVGASNSVAIALGIVFGFLGLVLIAGLLYALFRRHKDEVERNKFPEERDPLLHEE